MTSFQEAQVARASQSNGARSSKNSRKHGLCSKKEVEKHEQKEYTCMHDELLDDIRPHGPLEKSAAERDQPFQQGLGSFRK